MALKPCRECKKKVSTEAEVCPHCGVPNPTIKIPVIKAGTLILFDKATDPKTSLSPPIAKSKIPIGKSKA